MKIGKKTAFILKILLICGISAGLAWSFNYSRPVPADNNSTVMQQPELTEIDGEQAIKYFDSGNAFFVDGRSDSEFAMGHIPGAYNLPYWAVHEELDGLITGIPKDKTIVVYCDGALCGKSIIVARKLIEKGFDNVFVYTDGLDGWLSLGRDLEGN
ncbi:rhodanese-like domain-containing protein [Desulfovibrio gilichinskyi]|uniref:Rhodanese-related sulfurtransferase n=1 Tax=Desulfovibrio gilichinskyi TaxID=1519643 RepID=A0A1X7CI13_9BACT|nr:rhodanese-like domain-containing protein [Desulfovibrio gilichinskyi]SME96963.1 Rhodanese-related sulfurtransferase [Desulfovibrio gilichinskyi]